MPKSKKMAMNVSEWHRAIDERGSSSDPIFYQGKEMTPADLVYKLPRFDSIAGVRIKYYGGAPCVLVDGTMTGMLRERRHSVRIARPKRCSYPLVRPLRMTTVTAIPGLAAIDMIGLLKQARSFLEEQWDKFPLDGEEGNGSTNRCCETSAFLAWLLAERGLQNVRMMDGFVRCSLSNDLSAHFWVDVNGVILDLTADQFGMDPTIMAPASGMAGAYSRMNEIEITVEDLGESTITMAKEWLNAFNQAETVASRS